MSATSTNSFYSSTSQSATARFLHVTNGTATAGVIAAAGIGGARSIWADPLYEGPVPGGLTDAELLDVRARYLAGGDDAAEVDPLNDLREWRGVIARHDGYDELVLWFEHDLFDQLNLIQLLAWIRTHLPAAKPVSLICVGSFPGRPAFKGLGELTPQELAPLLDARRPVSDAQYAVAQRAWEAFRASTPEGLDRFRHTDARPLPYLAPAIGRFLQEYPWTTDGLSRSERRLLQLARDRELDLSTAFPRMQDGEDAYYITDVSLSSMARALSALSPPLLIRNPAASGDEHDLRATVTLSETGRAVLARRRDRIETCGIDRWFGGVHLQGRTQVWRWDDARQQVVRS